MDLAQTINFYAVQTEKIFAEKEAERLANEEKIKLENERIEQERIKQEKALEAKLAKERERKKLEEEKRLKAETIKNKIAENKKKPSTSAVKETAKESFPAPKRRATTPLHRISPCHESREILESVYCKL